MSGKCVLCGGEAELSILLLNEAKELTEVPLCIDCIYKEAPEYHALSVINSKALYIVNQIREYNNLIDNFEKTYNISLRVSQNQVEK